MSWRALKRFVLPPTVAGELVRAFDAIWEWSQQLQRPPFLDGVEIRNLLVGTLQVTVPHKLGRVPRGCIVLRSIGQVAPEAVSQTQMTATTITLVATGDVLVDVWVF